MTWSRQVEPLCAKRAASGRQVGSHRADANGDAGHAAANEPAAQHPAAVHHQRGRQRSEQGRAIGAGEITALVQGTRRTPYRVRVRLRTFRASEWDTVFAAIAARAAHAAALLDGELDPGVVDAAADAGVDLLPGPGELQPRCSCPDWADLCKHSAAVCYLVAQALDHDPFGLFLLRGLDRDAVLSGVRKRRASADDEARPQAREMPPPEKGCESRQRDPGEREENHRPCRPAEPKR